MEVGLILLVVAILTIFAIYLYPLFAFRLTRKRVVVKYIDREGHEEKIVLFLTKDDPLWRAIELHKASLNASCI